MGSTVKQDKNANHKRALLIVDDEQSVTLTLKMIFERCGYRVRTAFSCAEALECFASGYRPDAVITDLNMEKADIGLEVAKAAKQLEPMPVVVICTGYADVENAEAALNLKVDFLATKPTNLAELVQALEVMLMRARVPAGGQRSA
jgi:CheY-like chemotaxis protein